jgi:hypothetical protein
MIKMRPSRIFRWIVRIFLLVFTLSLSAVSLLGGFSAVTVLDPDSYNINIPDGPVSANLDISDPNNMNITVPFNISNVGVYDLKEITLGFQIRMTYGNSSTPTNETTTIEIFNKQHEFGDILHGAFLKDDFTGSGSDGFFVSTIQQAETEVDWTRTPYAVEFYASFTFSAWYSLNLYKFTVYVANFSLGHFP